MVDEGSGRAVGLLAGLPEDDLPLRAYAGERGACVWSTVTPVILPGDDGRDARKAEALLRKALVQAGQPRALVDGAELEWRKVGFRAGVDLAGRYRVGGHHQPLPRYHVRITWPTPLVGPLAVGTGRYYGLGLFAAELGD